MRDTRGTTGTTDYSDYPVWQEVLLALFLLHPIIFMIIAVYYFLWK